MRIQRKLSNKIFNCILEEVNNTLNIFLMPAISYKILIIMWQFLLKKHNIHSGILSVREVNKNKQIEKCPYFLTKKVVCFLKADIMSINAKWKKLENIRI